MKPFALSVEQLTVNLDKTPVLWDVHFEIPQGKLVGIIGPNGAGKTTLLKCILGMIPALSGRVRFFDQTLKAAQRRLAYVPQRSSVDWDFPITVFDVVLMGRYARLGLFKRPSQADKEAALHVLEMVGMSAFAKRQINQLSGGQKQKLFVARALLQEADLYLMDEPFAGIDMATEKELMALFNQLRAEGKTLLIVHHDLAQVTRYFDWLVMLNTCLIASGPTKETFQAENILRTYGRSRAVLDDLLHEAQSKSSGLLP
jgi:manganese/zinc/iron transport system ATP- binding protein